MEPITALSVGAAAIQFLDFGSHLLSNTLSIYQSATGQRTQDVELSAISHDIQAFVTQVQRLISTTSFREEFRFGEVMERLCLECKYAGDELEDILAELRASGVTRLDLVKSSFVAALKSLKRDSMIRWLQIRMDRLRTNITGAVIVCLWEESRHQGKTISLILDRQTDLLMTQVPTMKDGRDAASLKAELNTLATSKDENKRTSRQAMVDGLWKYEWQPTDDLAPNGELSSSGRQSHREEAISQAHKSTFEWIFANDSSRSGSGDSQWDSFPRWLTGTTRDCYWITGKPGSGKSTLMKFIAGSDQFKRLVAGWSGDTPFVLATFYSWHAGVELQKSLAGFARTILAQCLEQEPGLARHCCLRRWSLYDIFGHDIALPDWTPTELRHSFDVLMSGQSRQTTSAARGRSANIVLLVDGLDEFAGDHTELVDLIKEISRVEGVRVCVSSRPWNVFCDAYQRNPSLRLENLTRGDILKFVRSSFDSHPGFLDLRAVFPGEAERLVDSVVNKAAGVFLWVFLVVRSLLAGFADGDKISDLQATLDRLPDDLENLYERLWKSVEDSYKAQGLQFFQIFDSCQVPLTASLLWLADEEAPHDLKLDVMGPGQINTVMKRRLASRTKGLLELSARGNIQYIHRTAFDWIAQEWQRISVHLPQDFDVDLELLKALSCAASIRQSANSSERLVTPDWKLVQMCLKHASRAAGTPDSMRRQTTYLDHLDRSTLGYVEANRCEHSRGLGKIGFSVLAALCEMWGCLEERVKRNPAAAVLQAGDFTVLEAAIFPNSCVDNLWTATRVKRVFNEEEQRRRLTLVELLLEAGADATRLCHTGNTIQQQLRTMYGAGDEYTKAVMGLLKRQHHVPPRVTEVPPATEESATERFYKLEARRPPRFPSSGSRLPPAAYSPGRGHHLEDQPSLSTRSPPEHRSSRNLKDISADPQTRVDVKLGLFSRFARWKHR